MELVGGGPHPGPVHQVHQRTAAARHTNSCSRNKHLMVFFDGTSTVLACNAAYATPRQAYGYKMQTCLNPVFGRINEKAEYATVFLHIG